MPFPRSTALTAARAAVALLRPVTQPERLIVAGSLRRMKEEVGDVELVFVPLIGEVRDGLFPREGDLAAAAIEAAVAAGTFAKRLNAKGAPAWGAHNKLAVHVATGVPVDFFSTPEFCFFNYLVCRTGSAQLNVLLCMEAEKRGLKWHPTGAGFEVRDLERVLALVHEDAAFAALLHERLPARDLRTGSILAARSERDVFTFAGLAWREPKER